MERWIPVLGFCDYAVSSLGRVKRIVPDRQGKNCGHVLKGWTANSGYIQVRLYRGGVSSSFCVHRIVCVAFNGNPPTPKHQASHNDGNRTNNKKSNISWKTPSENNLEKHRHGTMLTGKNHPSKYWPESVLRGSKHGNAKLSESAVMKIRKDTRSAPAIGREYGVCSSMICKIKNHIYWKHVS